MKRRTWFGRLWRVWIPGGSLFLLGGCGLSDVQLTSIFQGVVETALTTIVTGALSCLVPEVSAA